MINLKLLLGNGVHLTISTFYQKLFIKEWLRVEECLDYESLNYLDVHKDSI